MKMKNKNDQELLICVFIRYMNKQKKAVLSFWEGGAVRNNFWFYIQHYPTCNHFSIRSILL